MNTPNTTSDNNGSPVTDVLAALEQERAAQAQRSLDSQAKRAIQFWLSNMEFKSTEQGRIGFLRKFLIRGDYDIEFGSWDYKAPIVAEAVRQLSEQGWKIRPQWSHCNFLFFTWRRLQGITFQQKQPEEAESVGEDSTVWLTKLPRDMPF